MQNIGSFIPCTVVGRADVARPQHLGTKYSLSYVLNFYHIPLYESGLYWKEYIERVRYKY